MSLTRKQRELLLSSVAALDSNFAPPLLWGSPKLSSWYAVGLLARGTDQDTAVANRVLSNVIASQWLGEPEIVHGTFPRHYREQRPQGDGSLEPSIYETFDPNNALFVTLAGIVIDACFTSQVEADVLQKLRQAMREAVKGDQRRQGGVDGDNLYPCYTNAFFMRCLCTSYVAAMDEDDSLMQTANAWTKETTELCFRYGTIPEYNSPTYAGITFLALGLAQFLPHNSSFRQAAPRLLADLWIQTGATYNPSLSSTAGPWDRTYGHDMRRYCSVLGFLIASLDLGQVPLNGSEHVEDAASIPMLMLAAPYITSAMPPAVLPQLRGPIEARLHSATAFSPPYDKRSRQYTFYIEKGLSVGGVDFDETVVGGPSINPAQFAPGVLMWDPGLQTQELCCISYHPTESQCRIVATNTSLSVTYASSRSDGRTIGFNVWLPGGHYMTRSTFTGAVAQLPGLELSLTGNIVSESPYLVSGVRLHGLQAYRFGYNVPMEVEDPTLVLTWKRLPPPPNQYKPCLTSVKQHLNLSSDFRATPYVISFVAWGDVVSMQPVSLVVSHSNVDAMLLAAENYAIAADLRAVALTGALDPRINRAELNKLLTTPALRIHQDAPYTFEKGQARPPKLSIMPLEIEGYTLAASFSECHGNWPVLLELDSTAQNIAQGLESDLHQTCVLLRLPSAVKGVDRCVAAGYLTPAASERLRQLNIFHLSDDCQAAFKYACLEDAVCATQTALAAEALALGDSAGLDHDLMYEAISGAAGSSWSFRNLAPCMLERDLDCGVDLEGLRTALALGISCGAYNPLFSQVEQLYRMGGNSASQLLRVWRPSFTAQSRDRPPRPIGAVQRPSHVGFIGLGAMGYGMAQVLTRAGMRVTGYDAWQPSVDRYTAVGGEASSDLAVCAASEVLVLMVVNAQQVIDVLFTHGAVNALPANACVLMMCTVSPSQARDLAQRVHAVRPDIHLVDAPVSGGTPRAASGDLTILCSGLNTIPPDTAAKARFVLRALSQAEGNLHNLIEVADGVGMGSAVKLVNQHLAGCHIVSTAEALTFAAKLNLPLRKTRTLLLTGVAGSWMMGHRGKHMLDGLLQPPTSMISIFVKDMGIVVDEASRTGVAVPLASFVHQQFLLGKAAGWGGDDDSR